MENHGMYHRQPNPLEGFRGKSQDHLAVLEDVLNKTPERKNFNGLLEIIAATSGAIYILFEDDLPNLAEKSTLFIAGIASVLRTLHAMSSQVFSAQARRLQKRHPLRFDMIVNEIRAKFPFLEPTIEEVKRELPGEENETPCR